MGEKQARPMGITSGAKQVAEKVEFRLVSGVSIRRG
jgi:hypothetical protein